jgi:hypothetical protein
MITPTQAAEPVGAPAHLRGAGCFGTGVIIDDGSGWDRRPARLMIVCPLDDGRVRRRRDRSPPWTTYGARHD